MLWFDTLYVAVWRMAADAIIIVIVASLKQFIKVSNPLQYLFVTPIHQTLINIQTQTKRPTHALDINISTLNEVKMVGEY